MGTIIIVVLLIKLLEMICELTPFCQLNITLCPTRYVSENIVLIKKKPTERTWGPQNLCTGNADSYFRLGSNGLNGQSLKGTNW